jgi:hypothetical protein
MAAEVSQSVGDLVSHDADINSGGTRDTTTVRRSSGKSRIVALIEAKEAEKPVARGPYKKRNVE